MNQKQDSMGEQKKTSSIQEEGRNTRAARKETAAGGEAWEHAPRGAATLCRGSPGGEKVKQEGRRADALALGAEERRGKLRKAAGRSTHPKIRGFLNGETRAGGTPRIRA